MFTIFPSRSGRRLRALTALVAALALLFVLAVSSSHRHRDSLDSDACAICSVGLHQHHGVADAALPAPHLVLLPYRIVTALRYRCAYARARLLPPGCGPPVARAVFAMPLLQLYFGCTAAIKK